MIIIHCLTESRKAAWMTAPFDGSGSFHHSDHVAPPREGWQVVAEHLTLDTIRAAISFTDEETALRNLETAGADLRIVPPNFRRRKEDRR